jgi:hypothetical protein
MYFNGVNNYVQVPYISVFNQQPFTVMGWISQLSIKADNVLFTTGDTIATDRALHLVIRNGYPRLGFYSDDLTSPTCIGIGVFYYLTFLWEGPATRWQRIYINAVHDSSRVSTGLLRVESGALTGYGGWVGRWGASFHYGYIAQVLIYSRALSDSEVLWNYQYPDNPIRNGLVLWLQAHPAYIKDIDGDGVLEWMDLSGFNNHGKIYGAQLVELVKTAKRVLTPARVLRAVR